MRFENDIDMPSSPEAERDVLGGILLDGPPVMDQCLRLQPSHFYLRSHAEIFEACRLILSKQADISPVIVAEHLGKDRTSAIGGLAYLCFLNDGLYRNWDATIRVDTILEMWRLRKGIEVCDRYAAAFVARTESGPALANLQAEVLDVIEASGKHDDPLVGAYSDSAWDSLMERAFPENRVGLMYGCDPLDVWTNGMQPGQVTAVGARSGVGKTSLLKQATLVNCYRGIPVTLFSLEASREELLNGLWAIVAGVEVRKVIRSQLMSPEERERVRGAMRTVSKWPLRIYERSDLTIDQICAYARMNIRQFGTKLIGVDYAQNVESEGKDERLRVSNVSRKLTKLTKDEGNSLMLLSQLRKVPHEAYSKPPTMADFRETGQIENDAHVGLLLHRPWDEENACISTEAQINIGKYRHGRTGALKVTFNTANLCFE